MSAVLCPGSTKFSSLLGELLLLLLDTSSYSETFESSDMPGMLA